MWENKKYSNNYSQYKWIEVSDQRETETYRRDIDNRHTTKDQNIKGKAKGSYCETHRLPRRSTESLDRMQEVCKLGKKNYATYFHSLLTITLKFSTLIIYKGRQEITEALQFL